MLKDHICRFGHPLTHRPDALRVEYLRSSGRKFSSAAFMCKPVLSTGNAGAIGVAGEYLARRLEQSDNYNSRSHLFASLMTSTSFAHERSPTSGALGSRTSGTIVRSNKLANQNGGIHRQIIWMLLETDPVREQERIGSSRERGFRPNVTGAIPVSPRTWIVRSKKRVLPRDRLWVLGGRRRGGWALGARKCRLVKGKKRLRRGRAWTFPFRPTF